MDRAFEYAVYADGEESRKIAMQALDGTAKVLTDWDEFVEAAEGARAGAVIVPVLNDMRICAITSLRTEYPVIPVVLVTDRELENLRSLARVPSLHAALFVDEAAKALSSALDRAGRSSMLLEAAALIETTLGSSSKLAPVLVRACQMQTPVRTIHALATRVGGYSETWFPTLWAKEVKTESRRRDFVTWLLAAHASTTWRSRDSFAALANRLGTASENKVGSSLIEMGERAWHMSPGMRPAEPGAHVRGRAPA